MVITSYTHPSQSDDLSIFTFQLDNKSLHLINLQTFLESLQHLQVCNTMDHCVNIVQLIRHLKIFHGDPKFDTWNFKCKILIADSFLNDYKDIQEPYKLWQLITLAKNNIFGYDARIVALDLSPVSHVTSSWSSVTQYDRLVLRGSDPRPS